MYELAARYDSRKSFYGKARVQERNQFQFLFSYGEHVATVNTDRETVELFEAWDTSATTLRHVKEFLKQYGFKAESKAQIARDYKEGK